ncbi:hypothetical protein EYF80_044084 [Liparis tanakae]|uniref:Uncharacterized protein n=1 Tax=Liparis tanakae TaxID=230148 RepID=A0A4Z2FYF8_9TELE|nr:hypothetical protein EYF80_044084 [Liparis tanakae]
MVWEKLQAPIVNLKPQCLEDKGPHRVLSTHSYLMLHADKELRIPPASSQEGCERTWLASQWKRDGIEPYFISYDLCSVANDRCHFHLLLQEH